MDSYLTPAGFGEVEYIEKKSRFIGRVWPVADEAEALARLRETREKHRDATHNVYAYILRSGGVMGTPSTQTVSRVRSALCPTIAAVPFTLTRPAAIHSSAVRREQSPAAAISFCKRSASAKHLFSCGEQGAQIPQQSVFLRLRRPDAFRAQKRHTADLLPVQRDE